MRKRTRRKHWNLIDPIRHAIEGASLMPQALLSGIRLRELGAIEAFRTGQAGLQEWTDVNALLTITETMARGGIGPEALPACASAQAALMDAARRFEATRKMGTTGLGLAAMRELYEYHDLQRASVCRSDYEAWLQRAMHRISSQAPEVVAL
jgi:hypothetical protein